MFIPSFGRRVRASALLLCLASIGYSQTPIPRGSILISHLSPDHALSTDEFIVLYNAGPDTVDLGGYEVRYATASGSIGSAGAVFPSPRPFPPARHLLIASRETVSVGSAVAIRDVPLTSGMAATGGQLVLRRVDVPDSMVFAVAWGSISTYAAGMTDAAAWPGDGMLSLAWNGTAYARSAYNSSNLEYQHTPAGSITLVPSLHPIVPPSPWMVSVHVRQNDAVDTSVVFGMSDAATDSFDIGLDLPAPPPPISGQLSVGIDRPDLNLATGDLVLRDLRAVRSLTDTSVAWAISVMPAQTGEPIVVMLSLRGLPSALPVRLRCETSASVHGRIGDSVSISFVPTTTDRHRLIVAVGDSTAPKVQFLEPEGPTTAVAGSVIRVRSLIADGSGLDTIRLAFADRPEGALTTVAEAAESLGNVMWPLPARLRSDSAQFRIEAGDRMGNRRIAFSNYVRVVPDTAMTTFAAGWHLVSTPLDPIDPRWSQTPGATTADSTFAFSYRHGTGYHLSDSLLPGRGYFLGLMHSRMIRIVGHHPSDSLVLPLSPGFVLVAAPHSAPVPLTNLAFIRNGIEQTYDGAIAAGWVGAGLYGYDPVSGGYVETDTLKRWHGYWFPVLEEGLSYRVSETINSSGGRVRSHADKGWRVRLHLASGGRTDSLVSLGVHANATDGFDAAFDAPSPPPPPGTQALTAWIEHPEWRLPTGPNFTSDVRTVGDGHIWVVKIRSDRAVSVSASWRCEGDKQVPGLELSLSTDGTVRSMVPGDTLVFHVEGTISVSIKATTTNVAGSEVQPSAFRLTSSYPNPFNGSTRIVVEVPRTGHLTVCVFDMLGREVARLLDATVENGRQSLEWTANQSTGTYLVRAVWQDLSGTNHTQTRRVVLLR